MSWQNLNEKTFEEFLLILKDNLQKTLGSLSKLSFIYITNFEILKKIIMTNFEFFTRIIGLLQARILTFTENLQSLQANIWFCHESFTL